jgi:hypothetical protein
MPVEDPITDAILGDGYERLRVESYVYLRYALRRKVAWQSYMLLSVAAILPVATLLPPDVRQEYLPVVATSTPKLAFVAFVAVVLIVGTAVGHLFVGWRTREDLDERTAKSLLTLENACSLVGFATAGLALGVSHGLVLLGFGPLNTYVALGGGNPFVASTFAPPIWFLSLSALVFGVSLRTAAAWLPRRV